MGLRAWWNATSTGVDVAGELIKQDGTDISEGTLYAMAEDLDIADADTFVETVFETLNEHDEDEWTREHGTTWEQLRRGTFSDDHPVLRRLFG